MAVTYTGDQPPQPLPTVTKTEEPDYFPYAVGGAIIAIVLIIVIVVMAVKK